MNLESGANELPSHPPRGGGLQSLRSCQRGEVDSVTAFGVRCLASRPDSIPPRVKHLVQLCRPTSIHFQNHILLFQLFVFKIKHSSFPVEVRIFSMNQAYMNLTSPTNSEAIPVMPSPDCHCLMNKA